MNKLIKQALFLIFIFQIVLSRAQSNGFEVIRSMELMNQIFEQLEKYYVDDIETGNLSKTAIDAMLNKLDPYTVYYHESDIEDYQLMTTGQYGGIGALIRKMDEHVYIAEPYEGNPAAKAGLRAGDKILEIDGNSRISGMPCRGTIPTRCRACRTVRNRLAAARRPGESRTLSWPGTTRCLPVPLHEPFHRSSSRRCTSMSDVSRGRRIPTRLRWEAPVAGPAASC